MFSSSRDHRRTSAHRARGLACARRPADARNATTTATTNTAHHPVHHRGAALNAARRSGDTDGANSSISGTKFNDLNGNGVRDAGEPPLSGAEIILSGFASETTFTDINGHFTFTPLQFGNYGVREIQQAGWIQTTPADSYSVALMF